MAIDLFFMRLFNVTCANPFFDEVIPFFSKLSHWKGVIFVAALLIVLRERWRGLLILGGVAITLLLSEGLSSGVMKPFFDRTRPCHLYPWVRLLSTFCPKSPSFTSSHAANIFAATTFLAFFFPRLRYILWGIASLVGFSRIYIGVHYPSDVVAGAVLGVGCASAVYFGLTKASRAFGGQHVLSGCPKGHRADRGA